jgi:signal transduction histidine kinase
MTSTSPYARRHVRGCRGERRLHEESARLLEEVQQLHPGRERFFAMVNHELRNALAAVYGWAEMLVRKKDPATVPRAAFEVLDSAQQAIGLINDLLDLSRLDEDRLKPVIRAVDPAAIGRRAVGRVTPRRRRRALRCSSDSAELPSVETDASRVEQILVNLLGNAIKHAPERTSCAWHQRHRQGHPVSGRRRGPGIPKRMGDGSSIST